GLEVELTVDETTHGIELRDLHVEGIRGHAPHDAARVGVLRDTLRVRARRERVFDGELQALRILRAARAATDDQTLHARRRAALEDVAARVHRFLSAPCAMADRGEMHLTTIVDHDVDRRA